MGYQDEKKISQYLKPFRYGIRLWQTDRRTDIGRG